MRVPDNVKFSPINFSFDTNFTVKLKENILFHLSEKATPELVSIITKEIDEKCEAHNTEHYTVYCYNCNKHLCSKCLEERLHDEHKKETLKKDLNIQQITESLEKAKNHIDKDLFDIKQRFMKNLMHKISDLEFAYGKCRNYNSATLMFVKSLIECYSNSQPNYFVKENLLKHTNFNFSCFQMDETEKETIIELDDVIEFYNRFVILAKPANDMGESKEEEEKQEIRSRLSTCSSMNLKGMKITKEDLDKVFAKYPPLNDGVELKVDKIKLEESKYYGEISVISGLRHGRGIDITNEGGKYEGTWVNNVPEGKGKFTFENGEYYEGDFIGGSKEGHGFYMFNNKSSYNGEWKNNRKNGYGILISSDGDKYEGYFMDNKKHGKGILTTKNGSVYKGDFYENNIQGYGIHSFNKTTYEGNWVNHERNGKGIETYSSGAKYEGNFVNNSKEGIGIYVFPNGDKYEGEFKDNTRSGKGIVYYSGGGKYEGDFKDGLEDGEGILEVKEYKYVGTFEKGIKSGRGVMEFSTGAKYEGEFSNNTINGKGKVSDTNGVTIEGTFINGQLNGQGKIVYVGGSTYVGEVKNNLRHGKGILIESDGTKYEGDFVNNKKEGYGLITTKDQTQIRGNFKDDIPVGDVEVCLPGKELWETVNLDKKS